MSHFHHHMVTQEERYEQMMHEPVQTLIPRLAIPTIISMLVTALYNMADTFFVSQISTSASAAVGIIFSLMALIQAFAFMIGMGGGNMISQLLGQKRKERAEEYAAITFFSELITGVVIAALGLSFLEPLVYGLGATETIAPYAMDYARYILLATPFMMSSFGMNNMLRFQGNSFYGMIGITTGGIINMFLDPILIFGFDMGIAGAAIATGTSQVISFAILLFQCNSTPSCISIQPKKFRPSIAAYRQIVQRGFPSLARQGIASLSVIILNFSVQPYGDAAIAAMSIVNRFTMFINSATIGFGQGFQPVCGFNFGAKNYRRVAQSYHFCLRVAFVFLFCCGVLAFVFAHPIIAAFRREDADVIRIGSVALRCQAVTFPLLAQLTMSNMFTQTIGYGFRATIVASLRQGICLIPVLLVLPPFLGLTGVQIAQPISDVLSTVIAFLITRKILQELNEKAKEMEAEEKTDRRNS